MAARSERIFAYAVAASLVLHAVVLGVLSTRAFRADASEPLEFVTVQFQAQAAPVQVRNPPVSTLPDTPQPSPAGISSSASGLSSHPGGASAAPHVPGGGDLHVASSGHGDVNVGPSGNTPPGWVPGEGPGKGSGTGPGQGNQTPTVVTPVPPPPPQVREVGVRVCSVSGSIPGRWCQSTTVRSFQEGREPKDTCSMCKAPEPAIEPAHHSIEAKVVKEKLLSAPRPSIPSSVRQASLDVSVTCRWTVGTSGEVSEVSVTSSCGIPALDAAVVDSVRRWRYSPATQDGVPRAVHKSSTFVFRR